MGERGLHMGSGVRAAQWLRRHRETTGQRRGTRGALRAPEERTSEEAMSKTITLPAGTTTCTVTLDLGGGLPFKWVLYRFVGTPPQLEPQEVDRGTGRETVTLSDLGAGTELSYSVLAVNLGDVEVGADLSCAVEGGGSKQSVAARWRVKAPWRTCRFNVGLRVAP
jgi:hypothetical protein